MFTKKINGFNVAIIIIITFLIVSFVVCKKTKKDVPLKLASGEVTAESPVSQPDLPREYPFVLIAGSKLKMYTHSMMRNIPDLHELMPKNLLEINPVAAKKLGINDGDIVRVESLRGSIRSYAKVTKSIDPRVVHLYHGFEESNCNILTDHKAFDPITGSVGLKSSLCKVIKNR